MHIEHDLYNKKETKKAFTVFQMQWYGRKIQLGRQFTCHRQVAKNTNNMLENKDGGVFKSQM